MLFGSMILEVAIGLFFIYLLLSLVCSAIGEYIEARFNHRARYLRQGITLLLNDTDGGGIDLTQQLYDHGLVRPLYRDRGKLPSYIPSRTFALALWNLATSAATRGDGDPVTGVTTDLRVIRAVIASQLPNRELRTALLTLIDEAGGDIEKARRNIEEWYDGMMDRVAGWYKRMTSILLLVLGVVLAAVINADTINIVQALVRDGALRSSVVAAAQQRIERVPSSGNDATPPSNQPVDSAAAERIAAENLRRARADVDSLGLPLGWSMDRSDSGDPRKLPTDSGGWLLKLFGIALTGFAVSQGAPFWFDLLNKFVVIRSTVKPSEKSRAQPSKDRPAPETDLREPRADGASAKG